MSIIDTSTWNPDADLNTEIEGIPLNADASIAQTWQALRVLMAAVKGDGDAIKSMIDVMQGATASADGVSGLVPKPEAGDQDKALKGDGTWGSFAAVDHVHGSIGSDGKVGTVAGKPLITGTGGAVQAGNFGTTAGTFCEGGDSRLSDARAPTSHLHGSITNDGKLGTASRAVQTDADGAVSVSSVTAAELGYLSGVTSAIQTQFASKADDSAVVHNSGTEDVDGSKTFKKIIKFDNASDYSGITGTANGSTILLCGASTVNTGAFIRLYGKDYATYGGDFAVYASIGSGNSNKKELRGKATGALTWDGDSIQTTSDERLKTPLSAVPDEVLDAWGDVEWGQFQMLESVDRKGSGARRHLGLVAQRVVAAFSRHGLDALAYGIVCHEQTVADGDGESSDVWMVRYAEALAMEAAFQRRRADRLEERVAALEEAVHG